MSNTLLVLLISPTMRFIFSCISEGTPSDMVFSNSVLTSVCCISSAMEKNHVWLVHNLLGLYSYTLMQMQYVFFLPPYLQTLF